MKNNTNPDDLDRKIRIFNELEAAWAESNSDRRTLAQRVDQVAQEVGVHIFTNRKGEDLVFLLSVTGEFPRDWTLPLGGEESVVNALLQAARRRGDSRPRHQVTGQARYLIRLYRRAQAFGVVVHPEDED